ncbi:replication-associated recombination protein A [Belliella kenyensis]|uniref:Replication-associated recombination protein A n=1 Tax=Belliella kenyensis TaxID=1472724 RepID=A0ABV8ERM6_9BACT|nr:replication-associated recombination protein A [Belliella kenyensis]MCH7403791.1 replication-associated recombination protein A [Belliella kenyensis]MDN3602425.1 replication-associated recombination protein A [Belliella kenyensis]
MIDNTPLAERMRPKSLEELIGQSHLTGHHTFLYRAIKSGQVPSLILWGPPGVGKTTIANIIANEIKVPFYTLSAISSGVKDIREVIEKARYQMGAVLFIDEIHRFNKSQQDALLGAVEKGTIRLIGATTENPSFEVNAALLSRCQVFTLNSLDKEDLESMIKQAMEKDILLKKKNIVLQETEALLRLSGGDGRKLLNLFEIILSGLHEEPIVVTNEKVIKIAQQKVALYDKSGELHYDIISAFIKSIRGSDPNAAVYWLARMIEGGEDVKFIARRLVILASEDIGNANPNALLLATNCFEAVKIIGYPESRIILSQCVTYLASSPKSNAAYMAINKAQAIVKEKGDLSVPLHLRNAPTKLMKDLNYGKDYKYAHDFEGNFVNQEFMPEEIKNLKLYEPSNNPRENELRKYLNSKWKGKYGY